MFLILLVFIAIATALDIDTASAIDTDVDCGTAIATDADIATATPFVTYTVATAHAPH